jgi:hypothetical protein
MNKMSNISEKLKSTTYSYTGKGEFENTISENSAKIKNWLNDLMPLSKQIIELNKQSQKEIKKRNYTRILTKLFQQEYDQFTYMNILIRDSDFIALLRQGNQPLIKQYNELKSKSKLKYPGRHLKYVEFDIFREFVTLYNVELAQKAKLLKDKAYANNNALSKARDNKIHQSSNVAEIMQNKIAIENAIKKNSSTTSDTNWTDLLLGKKSK